ncbi:TetR/AcrR family transcriptional regulator, partial [Escherichia coli]
MTAVAIKCFIYSPSVLLGICGQHIALILCCCFNISGRRQPYRTTYWIRISKVTAKSILSQHRRPLFMPANMNRPHHARKTRSCSPEKTARTRQQIARAALEEFSAQGFARASISNISKRAGVAKGTVYNYFPTKELLFEAVLK